MKNYVKKLLALLMAICIIVSITACGADNTGGDSSTGNNTTGNNDTGSGSDTAGDSDTNPGEAATLNVKDEINIPLSAENAVYDLHKTSSNGSRVALCGTVYEQLMTLNGSGEPVPELCESYEVNADATEFTFKLRQGVKFHDGSEMTADDVVASLNRWADSYSAVAGIIGDARFEKVDDTTVSIKTDHPSVTLLYMLAGGAQRAVITTEEAIASEGEDGYMTDIIGTGPYT